MLTHTLALTQTQTLTLALTLTLTPSKESTARVVGYKQLGIKNSLTMEAWTLTQTTPRTLPREPEPNSLTREGELRRRQPKP